jgi:hypothetical protein
MNRLEASASARQFVTRQVQTAPRQSSLLNRVKSSQWSSGASFTEFHV